MHKIDFTVVVKRRRKASVTNPQTEDNITSKLHFLTIERRKKETNSRLLSGLKNWFWTLVSRKNP